MSLIVFLIVVLLILFLHLLAYPRREGGDKTYIPKLEPIFPLQKFLENVLLPFVLAALAYLLMGK
ncbi:hypothetical protein [Streptococcus equinus]|uniref:hypothetical protein n=1 Tax=Streptococcus equinus TaxID=1335 RepID=UPI0008DF740E|nr:hypothetical protein [Streptococcus equinus]SFF73919.1 hypothetical protein SAMN05216385_0230 [Streptococcus equinus]